MGFAEWRCAQFTCVTGTKVQIVTQLLRSLRTGNVSLHHAWRHRQPAGTSSLRPHTLVVQGLMH